MVGSPIANCKYLPPSFLVYTCLLQGKLFLINVVFVGWNLLRWSCVRKSYNEMHRNSSTGFGCVYGVGSVGSVIDVRGGEGVWCALARESARSGCRGCFRCGGVYVLKDLCCEREWGIFAVSVGLRALGFWQCMIYQVNCPLGTINFKSKSGKSIFDVMLQRSSRCYCEVYNWIQVKTTT